MSQGKAEAATHARLELSVGVGEDRVAYDLSFPVRDLKTPEAVQFFAEKLTKAILQDDKVSVV